MFRKLLDREEMLVITMATDNIGAVMGDALPEETRNIVVAILTGQLVFAGRADGFGDLCVGVQAVERIHAASKRIKSRMMIKFAGHAQVFRVSSDRVQVS